MTEKKGFTLVELLVVIVIIGILMAILLPAIAKAIQHARATRCQNNLSQLIKACYNYSVTKTPIEGNFHDHLDGSAWVLWLYTTNEVQEWQIFNCPIKGGGGPGVTSYRGYKNTGNPNGMVNQAPGTAITMADGADDHLSSAEPDVAMNYALKSGSSHKTPHNGAIWMVTVPQWVQ